jgi:putative hydrolase of the HAD superfamily
MSVPAGAALARADVVFFDAGFTLVEPTRSIAAIYAEAARDVGHVADEAVFARALASAHAVNARRPKGDDTRTSEEAERAGWRAFTARVAREANLPDVLCGRWTDLLFERFDAPSSWRPIEKAHALLDALRARGKKLAIVSNWHAALHGVAAAAGVAARVDLVVASSEAGFRKPDPRIFAKTRAALGVAEGGDAGAVVHVGDSYSDDVLGARAASITPIWLSMGARADADVATAPSLAALFREFEDADRNFEHLRR